MTVKEIFDLRKQGRIEEAYDAIRPMYAAHKGCYTTLCMFWTAADVFKLRVEQNSIEEAEKILEALKRMLPRVEEINKQLDSENATSKKEEAKYPWEHNDKKQEGSSAAAFIASATRRLAKVQKQESKKEEMQSGKDSFNSSNCSLHNKDSEEFAAFSTCSKKEELTDNSRPITRQLTSKDEPKVDIRVDSCNPCSNKEPATGEISAISVISARQKEENICVTEEEVPTGQIITRTDLNAPQRIVLACLVAHPGYSVPQISESTGIPAKSVERHISTLIDHGLIEHRGSKKTGGYYAL